MRKLRAIPSVFAIAAILISSAAFAEVVNYKLTWDKDANAKSYDVEVAPATDFAKTVQSLNVNTNAASFDMEPKEPKYYFRFRSVDAAGKKGAWSQVAELAKPAAATTTTPAKSGDTIPPLVISTEQMTSGGQQADMYSLPAGKSLVVRFNPKDMISGVSEVYAKVNGGSYGTVPNSEMRLTADGAYIIEWYAVDKAGNKSAVKIQRIYLDSTPPSIVRSIEASKVASDGAVAKTAKLSLVARDEGSGLDKVEWRPASDGEWKVYDSAIALASIATNDTGLVQYKAKDKLGNETTVQSYSFRIQSNPPVQPVIFADMKEPHLIPREGQSLADFPKGALVEYKVDNSDFRKLEPGEKIVITQEGEHTIVVRVTDEVGNVSEKTYKVVVDNTPPKSEMKTELAP